MITVEETLPYPGFETYDDNSIDVTDNTSQKRLVWPHVPENTDILREVISTECLSVDETFRRSPVMNAMEKDFLGTTSSDLVQEQLQPPSKAAYITDFDKAALEEKIRVLEAEKVEMVEVLSEQTKAIYTLGTEMQFLKERSADSTGICTSFHIEEDFNCLSVTSRFEPSPSRCGAKSTPTDAHCHSARTSSSSEEGFPIFGCSGNLSATVAAAGFIAAEVATSVEDLAAVQENVRESEEQHSGILRRHRDDVQQLGSLARLIAAEALEWLGDLEALRWDLLDDDAAAARAADEAVSLAAALRAERGARMPGRRDTRDGSESFDRIRVV